MIKLIVFDCWATLFYDIVKASGHESELNRYSKMIGKSTKDHNYIKVLEKNIMTDEMDIVHSTERLLKNLNIEPNQKLIHEMSALIMESKKGVYEDVFTNLKRLKDEGYKLALLSNTNIDSFKKLEVQFEKIIKLFDFLCLSYQEHVIKPDPRIFEIVLNKFSINPSEALMIGDNPEDDIEAAIAVGMKAILIDRENKYPENEKKIISLSQLTNDIIN